MRKSLLIFANILVAGCSSPAANTSDPALTKELISLEGVLATTPHVDRSASVEAVAQQVKQFAEQGAVIQRGAGSADSTCQHLASQLASKLSDTQSNLFPQLRQAYLSNLIKSGKQEGIKVECVGPQCSDIRFINSRFSNAQFTNAFKSAHWQPLIGLRFQRVLFQWNKGDGESTLKTDAMADAQVSDRVSGN